MGLPAVLALWEPADSGQLFLGEAAVLTQMHLKALLAVVAPQYFVRNADNEHLLRAAGAHQARWWTSQECIITYRELIDLHQSPSARAHEEAGDELDGVGHHDYPVGGNSPQNSHQSEDGPELGG